MLTGLKFCGENREPRYRWNLLQQAKKNTQDSTPKAHKKRNGNGAKVKSSTMYWADPKWQITSENTVAYGDYSRRYTAQLKG